MRERHGLTPHGRIPPEYWAWQNMKRRCLDPKSPKFHIYGARGIAICPQWRDSFSTFLCDVGQRPTKKHSLDRIDVNGNYEPGNVRWATPQQQQRNTRTTIRLRVGERDVALGDLADESGIAATTIRRRLLLGWSVTEALNTPVYSTAWNTRRKNREQNP